MSDCFDSLKANFPNLTDKQIRDVLKDLEDTKEASETLKDFRQKIMARVDEIRLNQAKYKMEMQQNFLKQQERMKDYNQNVFEGKPVQAIENKINGGKNTQGKNTNLGFKIDSTAMTNKIMTPFVKGLRESGLMEQALAATLDRQTMMEIYELRPGGKPGISKSPQAMQFANLVKAVHNAIRGEWDAAGYPIGDIPGYIMRQAHDAALIVADKAGWIKNLLKNLDHDKTFGEIHIPKGTPEDKIELMKQAYKLKYLDKVWKDISDGTWHSKDTPQGVSDQFLTTREPGAGKKLIGSRSLHFKDGESFYDYNQAYGKKSLLDTVFSTVKSDTLKIAQVKQFGSNPYEAMINDIARLKTQYSSEGAIAKYGAEKAASIVKDLEASRKGIIQKYELAARMNQHPGVNTYAKVSEGVITAENMSKLGLSSLKKFTEWKEGAGLISAITGENYFKALTYMAKDFFSTGRPVIPFLAPEVAESQRNLIAKFLINHIDDYTAALNADRYGTGLDNPRTPGLFSKMENVMYNLGINQHTNASRLSVAMTLSRFLGQSAEKEFGDLHPRLQANFGRWGIGQAEWDVIRQGMDTFGHDSKGITADAIGKIDPAKVQAVMDKYGISGKPEKFLANVTNKQLAMFLELTERTVLHTDGKTGAFMYGKFQNPNDLGSAIMRVLTQYKSIALMFGNNQAMMLGSGAENFNPSFTRAMLNGVKDGSILKMAAATATGMGLYHLRNCIYNELHGKPMPDFNSKEEMLKTFIGSGAGGIYGDIYEAATGGFEKMAKAVAGPGITEAGDAFVSAVSRDKRGNWKPNTQKLVNTAENLTPFQSVPFARSALDTIFYNPIHNAIDPNYVQKRDMREMKRRAKGE